MVLITLWKVDTFFQTAEPLIYQGLLNGTSLFYRLPPQLDMNSDIAFNAFAGISQAGTLSTAGASSVGYLAIS